MLKIVGLILVFLLVEFVGITLLAQETLMTTVLGMLCAVVGGWLVASIIWNIRHKHRRDS